MSQGNIQNPHTLITTFSPKLIDKFKRFGRMKFKGICWKQDSVHFLHKNISNFCISYKSDTCSKDLNIDFTLDECLFGAVKLTNNADTDKCKYSGYGREFDSRSKFLWKDGSAGENVIIFGVNNSSSVHIDGWYKSVLVLGDGPTKCLDNAVITVEAKCPINFTETGKRFVLSPHYNGRDSFLFVNAVKMYKFKAKHSEIKPYPLCFGNISKDFTLDNMKIQD